MREGGEAEREKGLLVTFRMMRASRMSIAMIFLLRLMYMINSCYEAQAWA